MKRWKVDEQWESMVASYKYLEVSGLTNDWEQWVWCFLSVWHPGLIPVYQKNSCDLLFSGLGSWNLVTPLLRINEAWKDECAARLQSLANKYKTPKTPNFCNKKFRGSIGSTRSCPRDKKTSLLKKIQEKIFSIATEI